MFLKISRQRSVANWVTISLAEAMNRNVSGQLDTNLIKF